MAKQPTPVQRLVAAMDRCAHARGEAQWMNGYRTAIAKLKSGEEERLYAKEQHYWAAVERAHGAFKRLAQRVLRDARKSARKSR